MSDLVIGLADAGPDPADPTRTVNGDQRARCRWGAGTLDYAHYHDGEWGLATLDERTLFEKLCLEGFQAGLSWLTILRKREGFRAAFARFDPPTVARFGPDDVDRLLADAGIVRHRGKIEAAIANARTLVELWERGGSLGQIIWDHEPPRRAAPTTMAEVPATTPESTRLSAELRRMGFRFVGPTTVYAGMQAMGVVNDHLAGCWVRDRCEQSRSSLDRPLPPG